MPINYGPETIAKAKANKAKQAQAKPATDKQTSLTKAQAKELATKLIAEYDLTAPAAEVPPLSTTQRSLDLVGVLIKQAKENK